MSEKILTTEINKEKGCLYYVAADENGKLCLFKAKAGRRHKEYIEPNLPAIPTGVA